MYTGVIRHTGRIASVTTTTADSIVDEPDTPNDGAHLRVSVPDLELEPGGSVAIDGVCLTVSECIPGGFEAYASAETVACTALIHREGEPVNVETPLSMADALDGHVTKGTVDATTTVDRVERHGDAWTYHVDIPTGHTEHVAPKGAVALDGVSLTIDAVDDDAGTFAVAVVPETQDRTTLSRRGAGAVVHFEADVLARYAARAAEVRS